MDLRDVHLSSNSENVGTNDDGMIGGKKKSLTLWCQCNYIIYLLLEFIIADLVRHTHTIHVLFSHSFALVY